MKLIVKQAIIKMMRISLANPSGHELRTFWLNFFKVRGLTTIFVLMTLFTLVATAYGQDVAEIEWIRQFGGVLPANRGDAALAIDTDGNAYVVGETEGSLPDQTMVGDYDAFIRKYNADGTEIWTRQFGTPLDDKAWGVSVNGSGIYIVGGTHGALPGQTNVGNQDNFIRKYDSDGNEIWTRQFGTASNDDSWGILADASGIYIAGGTFGAFPNYTNSGDRDAFVCKYDTDGNDIWIHQFGTTAKDGAWQMCADGSGIYVAGATWGVLPGQTSSGSLDAFVRKFDFDGNEIWTRQFGTVSAEYGWYVVTDGSGIYVGGETLGTLPGQTNVGNWDVFVRKYDSNGTEVWTQQFGTASGEYCWAMTADGSGIYIGGPTHGTLPGQTSSGGGDVYVRKYDAYGNELWTHQFGTPQYDDTWGISSDGTSVYVSGYTYGTLPDQTSTGGQDAFVRKYDTDGNEIWTRQFGSIEPDLTTDSIVSVDTDGNIYVCGYTSGSLQGQINSGNFDVFVAKYDADGNNIWTRQFGSAVNDFARGIAVDASGVYVSGNTDGNLPGQNSIGGSDVFVRKYDFNGTVIWTRQFGSTHYDYSNTIAVYESSIYVAGYTWGTIPGLLNKGLRDVVVFKYDIDGNEIWTRQFGTTFHENATGIAVDASGVYVCGLTSGSLQGHTNAGDYDGFVVKYDADGTENWTHQFGTKSRDISYEIDVYAQGIYMAGSTNGTFPGQSNAGNVDAFVCKYDFNGNEVWIRQFGSISDNRAQGIDVDASGVYVSGSTYGTLPGQNNAGRADAFVCKYNIDATEQWTLQFGTPRSDGAHGIAIDALGKVYVGGSTHVYRGDAYLAKIMQGTSTPEGPSVVVEPRDTESGETPVIMTFDQVTTAGISLLTTSQQGSPPPSGFKLGSPPTYYEITTTAEYSGLITVCISYNETDFNKESNLKLMHFEDGAWVDCTFSLDTENNIICGEVSSLSQFAIFEVNEIPIVECITAPMDPVLINTEVTVSANFTDQDISDTHTAEWSWGDGSTSPGIVTMENGSGSVEGSHTYPTPGVYTVRITVTDGWDSGEATYQYVVVYDPDGGFVTGGGWINSPEGAYAHDSNITGKASFGFVSKYKKGKTVPTGQTQFQFKVADLNFHSDVYEWLLIAGAKAKYKGSGSINGEGNYGFMLSAIDETLTPSTDVDLFRIKIWDKTNDDEVVYDNQMGDEVDADATFEIGGGSIVIHKSDMSKKGVVSNNMESDIIPESFALYQNHPNPFNPETNIRFQLPEPRSVIVKIYNTLGMEVRTLVDQQYDAGIYNLIWNGKDNFGSPVPSGIYIYKMKAGNFTQVKKMSLLR